MITKLTAEQQRDVLTRHVSCFGSSWARHSSQSEGPDSTEVADLATRGTSRDFSAPP
jgi:hypothetical protein